MATISTVVSSSQPPPSYEEAVALPPQQGPVAPPPSYDMITEQPCPHPACVHNPPIRSQPNASGQTVVLRQTLGSQPVQLQCPMCRQLVITRLEHRVGALPWLICAGLIFLGCFCGCCLIPFFMDDLKDVIHWCPNCHNVLGVYRQL